MKEVFQADKARTQWLADVVAHPHFKEACVFAIAQHARLLGGSQGDELRMKGAVEIFRILESLPKIERAPEQNSRLTY